MLAKTGSRTPLGSRPSQTLPVRPATKRPSRAQKPQLNSLDAEYKPLPANSPRQPRAAHHLGRLIATPRLEFPLTPTKLSLLTCTLSAVAGNRDYIAVFQISPSRRRSENRSSPLARVEPGLPVRNAGVPPALFTFAHVASQPAVPHILPLLGTHGRAFRTAAIPPGAVAFSPLVTHHSPLITAFLIYGAAIRNPRKP